MRRRELVIPIAYALFGMLWIAGSDYLLAALVQADATALAWASGVKGLGFILLTAVLLSYALRSARQDAELSEEFPADTERIHVRHAVLAIGFGAALLLAVGAALYGVHGKNLLNHAHTHLQFSTIQASELVARELAELRADAQALAAIPFLGESATHWISGGAPDLRQTLVDRLQGVYKPHDGGGAALLGPDGRLLLAAGKPRLTDQTWAAAARAIAIGAVAIAAPELGSDGLAYLEVHAPLRDPRIADAEPAANVVLWVAVAQLTETWSVLPDVDNVLPSFLLVGPRDDRHVLLSGVRHPSPAMTSVPGHLQQLLADAGAAGSAAPQDRVTSAGGRELLVVSSRVPGSDWYVIATLGSREILGPLRHAALAGAALVVAGAILLAVLLVLWWQQGWRRWFSQIRSAEQRAAALVSHFSLANRNANDIVLLEDEAGRIVEANPAAVEAYQYARAEFLARTIANLREPCGDDSVEMQQQPAEGVEDSKRFEAVHRRKDGSTFPVEISSRRFDTDGRTYVQSIVRDITQRRREQQLLEDSERRFRATFEQAAVGIAHSAPDGRWLRVNSKLCQILGYGREELLQKTLGDVTHPADLNRDFDQIKAIMERSVASYSIEKRFLRRDSSVVWARLWIALVWKADRTPDYFISVIEDVSDERRQREKIAALAREREALTRRLGLQFAGMPFGCAVMDAKLRVVDANPAFERLFGWSREELVQSPDAIALIVPAEERPSLNTELEATFMHGGNRQRINGNVTRDGRRITCRWTNVVLPGQAGEFDGMFAMCEDITESLAAERNLREREERFRALAEIAPVGVFRAAPDGRLIYSNPAMDTIGGMSAAPAARFVWEQALHREDRSRARENWVRLARGERVGPDELRYVRGDGSIVWGQVQIAPVRAETGGVVEFVGTVTDITALKDIERNLAERVEQRTLELRVAKERAEQSDTVKTEFLATMSHELRSPLGAIIGFTSVLLERLSGPLNDQQQRQLQTVRDAANNLLALINDLLDISRIEVGQLRVDLADIEVAEVLQRVTERFELQAQQQGLVLAQEVAAGLPPLRTDERRLEQIVSNLLSNAVKFTDSGSVLLRAVETAGGVEISVRDTGIGIRSEDLAKLFMPFTQLVPRHGKLHEGTGLGLAISWRLARALGGTLAVASRLGQGSTFTLRLPLST